MNINDNFFSPTYQQVWKHIIPKGLTEAETDFIEEIASLKKGDHVLDIMSGYGRHSLELAKRGYKVTAVENSAGYVNELFQKAQTEDLSIKCIQSTMQDVDLTGKYDAVICMGNSLAFFNAEETKNVFYKISNALHPNGVFIINTWMIAEIAIRHFKNKDWYYAGPYKYLLENSFHLNPSRIESIHIIISEDKVLDSIKGIDYIFTISELSKMLREEGMEIKHVYSTPRKKTFNLGDSTAYIVAVKN